MAVMASQCHGIAPQLVHSKARTRGSGTGTKGAGCAGSVSLSYPVRFRPVILSAVYSVVGDVLSVSTLPVEVLSVSAFSNSTSTFVGLKL